MGTYKLPGKEEMEKYDRDMVQRCHDLEKEEHHYDHACIEFQGDYLKSLLELTDYPSFDPDAIKKVFYEWEEHKQQGIMGFRDNSYKSVMTGKVSPPLLDPNGNKLAWKDALYDTCENFGLADMFEGDVRKVPLK